MKVTLKEILKYRHPGVEQRFCKFFNKTPQQAKETFEDLMRFFWASEKHEQDKISHPENKDLDFTFIMDEKGNHTQDYSDELNKLLGYIKNLDYMFSMDSEKFVGWPCFEKLGGYRTSNVIRDEKYRMGAEDSHPNKEGHRIIANHLLEEWNKIYK